MKRIVLLIGACALIINTTGANGQENVNISEADTQHVIAAEQPNTELTIGNDVMKITSDEAVTSLKLGNRIINLTDGDDGPKVKVIRSDRDERDNFFSQDDDSGSRKRSNRYRFQPHWSGFEFGLNNYLAADYATTLPPAYNFMDLNTGKSFNMNINFAQLGMGITRHFGLVTGLGLEFNDYVFEGNNNITKNDLGEIIEYDADLDGITLDKSKLSTTYFVVPVMLELQIPVERHHTINIAGGVIGGAKVSSHTKMVYYDDGKQKVKEKNDYSLNMLRYGPTVRVGYESFQFYATYYMNGLFQDGKGPELYPIQVGVAFTFD